MLLKVNYGINQKSGKSTLHKNGKLEIEGDWESRETHDRIKEKIREINPGWNITGYAWDNQ